MAEIINKESIKEHDFVFKIVLIGDTAVGKSAITERFTEQKYNDTQLTTLGVDFKIRTIEVDKVRVKIQVWDTAGQERFRVITRAYYRNASGVIIVYDLSNGDSFANTKRWIEEVKNNCSDETPIVLVANKCDSKNILISYEDQVQYAQLMDLKLFFTSAKKNINIDDQNDTKPESFKEINKHQIEK